MKINFEYRDQLFEYSSKINKKGGDFGYTHTFGLENERKIHNKIKDVKMKLSLHKQHRVFLFNYRLVSETEISLSRLITETNAVFEVPFEYKNGIKLVLEMDMKTHEASQNQIAIKLLGIEKTYPPIRFISDKAFTGGSSASR